MIDVSELVQRDAGTGIQRVTKNIMIEMYGKPASRFPGRTGLWTTAAGPCATPSVWRPKLIGLPDLGLARRPGRYQAGDILLGVDLSPIRSKGATALNRRLRQRGVRVYYVVYDLLPLNRPEWFPPFPQFRTWLQRIGDAFADGLVCISRAVADQLLRAASRPRTSSAGWPLKVGHFHLGADIGTGGPASRRRKSGAC